MIVGLDCASGCKCGGLGSCEVEANQNMAVPANMKAWQDCVASQPAPDFGNFESMFGISPTKVAEVIGGGGAVNFNPQTGTSTVTVGPTSIQAPPVNASTESTETDWLGWFKESMFFGLPNWTLLVGVGGLALVASRK